MGLFSRKSSEPKTSTQPKKQQINADDIWNTPVKRAGGDTAFVKESRAHKGTRREDNRYHRAGNYPQQDGAA